MLISHKIELSANNKQSTYFSKACGTARFAYNWALNEWKNQYILGLKTNEMALRRQLNSIKKEQFPWMLEVTKNAPQMAIINLGEAFKRFFKGISKYPQFKKKGHSDSFSLTNDQFKLSENKIKIPHLGWVKLCEKLRFSGKIISATISRIAQKWFVSITVETNFIPQITENQGVVGIDLGGNPAYLDQTGNEKLVIFVGVKQISKIAPHATFKARILPISKNMSR